MQLLKSSSKACSKICLASGGDPIDVSSPKFNVLAVADSNETGVWASLPNRTIETLYSGQSPAKNMCKAYDAN